MRRQIVIAILTSLAVANCGTRNVQEGLNGVNAGYTKIEVAPGFFRIFARTAPTLFAGGDAAREIWKGQAAALCGGYGYREFDTRESSYDFRAGPPSTIMISGNPLTFGGAYTIYTKEAFALCANSQTAPEQAEALIRKGG